MITTATASILDAFNASVDAAASVPTDPSSFRPLTDTDFAELCRVSGRLQQLAQTLGAVVAGEIAHRSRPELGSAGLAQRHGHRTPEEMVKVTTGATGQEASKSVRIGRMVHEAQDAGTADPITGELQVAKEPWLAPVARAVAGGTVSVPAADAIRYGLGAPSENVPLHLVVDAAARLCELASTLDPDRLLKRARAVRDELDAAGIADREQERRDNRALRLRQLPDGMGRLTWDMDPETYVVAKEIFDRATSPKLGGPRFQTKDQILAERILNDGRSAEQVASDTFLHLLVAGASADSSLLLGDALPAVRVLVSAADLREGAEGGRGYFEGHPDAVSIATVQRIACSAGIVPVIFDEHGQPLDVAREQRLFNKKQRLAIGARDGGCMTPGCGRDPEWCEAHHILHWHRDTGPTNVDDGILLCKHHHLLYHNNNWEIERRGSEYWLIPPPDIDPEQTPIRMHSNSAAYERLRKEQRAS